MEAVDSQGKTITLVIKTPSRAVDDQTVEGVRLDWTVKDLKTHLAAVYPTQPTERDQKLIYAGKLLPDHLHMGDLFREPGSIPTLHLVFAVRMQHQSSLGESSQVKYAEQPHLSSRGPKPSSASSSPSGTAGLRQRNVAGAQGNVQTAASRQAAPAGPRTAVPGTPQMTRPAFPAYSLYSPQQLLWLQHAYAQQYFMQCHAAWAAAGTVPSSSPAHPPVPAHQVPLPAPIANQNPINNLQAANQNPAQDGAFMDPAIANQNMRMNAQGGPVVEDQEDLERDWLDRLYSAARFGVLLMIIYFNSDLSRFLLVMGTILLIYLHTTGWFTLRRREQVQGPNPMQPPEVLHNQEDENRIPHPAANTEGPTEPMTAVLVPPLRASIMWTVWVFFKTFFSSLVPEAPRGVAN
ncbi:homocysteine-responsive endoplasmic reticulum-resident ubiquitin-like domain member 1 protein isoform X2 [Dunckerocampus dactyliophorus]|uniref:homocysteine-responsive endoplasmic reticulum-resident ubiquitin-like domain member 1 protein isoform X2 n=1 Tax=Dunckerocampus dactyliophorus TaxID=161453 RepID=UPI002406BEF3|nr:homocysteine-responsive endoplasmic reticulum-resident ubiquitin-like domain member 1 protein isoform X2 [Dunckerocampus dactyliophorus]